MTEPRVVHQDGDLLVIDKPSGLATTSPDGENCLASWAREHDLEAPRMHASSRLDAEVTGLVTFARTTRAIEQLTAARTAGQYRRFYLGLARQPPEPLDGEWRFPIGRDPRDPRRRVALANGTSVRGGKGKASTKGFCLADSAWSRYRTLSSASHLALLLLQPETGRTHQLRVHAARGGAPLWGDKHYGGPVREVMEDGRVLAARRVMLHCAKLILPGIARAEPLVVHAPVPEDMRGFFVALGGDSALLAPSSWS
ncbi:MAG TPA: pseudouridine synthase [Polyangiales bacterium]|jgi:23S rRNA-/tRNA-specific pseudouridylate synthase|nr:pseudouridine synthase [Polyangiales bacterium]